MSNIAYNPVKDKLGVLVGTSRFKRRVLFFLLDLIFLRSWYVRKLLKKVASRFDNKDEWSLLDAGCGFGQYDRFILSSFRNVKIAAIDLKEDYLNDCRRYFRKEVDKKRISFYQKDLQEIDYYGQFDVVICVDVLEHIEDDEAVLKNIGKSLPQDGYFIMHSPSNVFSADSEKEDFKVGEHYRQGYNKKELSQKLDQAGIKPLEVGYSYGFAGHLAWKIGVRFPMLLASKTKSLGLLLMPVYLLLILPVFLTLNYIDTVVKVDKGRGIYAVGCKHKNN